MKRKYLTFYKIGLFFLVYLGFMFIFNIKVWAGTLITLSSTSYDRGNSEIANGVAADSNNNIIITGESYNGTNYDWFTIKYDSNLVIISSIVYDAGGSNDELAYDVTVDGNDNIIVTGYSNNGINDNYFTIKYDNNLVVITSAGYDGGGDDVAYGVTVDGNNNIIVAGYTTIIIGLDRDYLTIKYDSNLVIISSVAYDVSNFDYAEGVATDDNNNIIVTGKVNDDYLTVKYDSNLMVISSATYDGFSADWAYGVTADSNNDIIVTGERFNGTEYDYLTIKYDSNLVVISSVAYDGGSNDYAEGVTTDDTNNIIVVGGSRIGGDYDYFTIKYDSNLVVISSAVYDGSNLDEAYAVTTDGNNNIIVTGVHNSSGNYDYFTIKYLGSPQVFSLSPFFAFSGETLYIVVNGLNFYNGADIMFSGTGITINSVDFISATQLRANITIDDNAFSGSRDITVANIDEATGILAGGFEIRGNISYQEEDDSRFVKLTPKIITPNGDGINDVANFIFTNPNNETVEGMIFDLSGSVVRDNLPSSSITSLTWDGRDNSGCIVSGKVYIYQIKVDGKVFNGTVVVAK